LFIVQLHSPLQKIKKGREGPLRTATVADGLAIPGGAPSHDYERLSNKIAHQTALSPLPCADLIWFAAGPVKQSSGSGCRRV